MAFWLIAAALLRLLLIAWVQAAGPDRVLAPDSPSYENPALALLAVQRFSASPDRPDDPESIRTPGYPLFIASIYAIAGRHRSVLLLAQAAVSVVTIAWTARLAHRLFGPRGAAACAAILALEPVGWAHVSLLLSETLFTLTIVAVLATGVAFAGSPGRRAAIFLGFACACAAWVRPIAYFLPFVVIAWMILTAASRRQPAKSCAIAAAFLLLPWVLLVGGWQARNFATTGSAEFSHVAGRTLYKWRAAGVVSLAEGISIEEARSRLLAELPQLEGAPAAEANRRYRDAALAVFRRHPAATVRVAARGLAQLACVPGERYLLALCGVALPERGGPLGDLLRLDLTTYLQRWLSQHRAAFLSFVLASVHLALLYAGVALAVWRIRIRRDRSAAAPLGGTLAPLCLLLAVSFAALSAGPEAEPRLRLPVTPMLALYAGAGLACGAPPPCGRGKV